MSEVTRILLAIEHGDPRAAEKLLPLVYGELRRLASQRLTGEAPGRSLQSSDLVHEAYERHWTYARTWLFAELKDRDNSANS